MTQSVSWLLPWLCIVERTEDPLVHKATSIQSGPHHTKVSQVWVRKGQGSCSPKPFRAELQQQQQQPGTTSFFIHHPHGSSSTTSY